MLLLGNGVLARLRAAMRSGGAGLGACEGTTDDAAGSAFTFKGTGAFEDEESIQRFHIRHGSRLFFSSLLGFDFPSFHHLLRPRFHAVALYASFSDQPYSQSRRFLKYLVEFFILNEFGKDAIGV